MKRLITALLIGSAIALTGCTTMKGGDSDVEVLPSKEVLLTNVSVEYANGQIEVTGTLHPTSSAVHRTGHVDVEFIGADDQVITQVRAEQHIKQFSRNSARSPTFSVTAEIDQSEVKIVRLTHHVDTQKECEL